jgi:hypothetical protein
VAELSEIAAIVASALLIALALFQAGLAGGSPWGRFAWGGQHHVLPPLLRGASFLALLVNAMFALVLLQKGGLLTLFPASVADTGAWVAVAFLAVSVPLNAISRSLPERLVMTPLAVVLVACALVIALGL